MFVRCCKHVTCTLKIFQRTFFFRGHLRNPNDPLLAPWRFFNLLWHLSGLCLKWGWRDSEMVSAYSQPEWNVTANTQTSTFDLHKRTAGVFSREQPHWIHNELLQHSFNSSLNFTPPQPRISCVTLMKVEKHISQFPKGQIENMSNSDGGYLWGPDRCLQSEEDKGQFPERQRCLWVNRHGVSNNSGNKHHSQPSFPPQEEVKLEQVLTGDWGMRLNMSLIHPLML